MAYRRTPDIERRLSATRARILDTALRQVATEGYTGTSVASVAVEAGVSTGGIYRYFPSKGALFAEVFAVASEREVEVCRQAAAWPAETELERLGRVVETFARRALRGPTLAWALIAEPVDPDVEAARLRFRRAYRDLFAEILGQAEQAGEVAAGRPVQLVAAALVGAIGEALLGPLSHAGDDGAAPRRVAVGAEHAEELVRAITAVCLAAARGDR